MIRGTLLVGVSRCSYPSLYIVSIGSVMCGITAFCLEP